MPEVITTRPQKLDSNNNLRSEIDELSGVISTYYNFGGASLPITVITLATAAVGAARGRIVGIIDYAAGATNTIIQDAAVQIFPTIYHAGQGNLLFSKEQFGDGGLIFTTSIIVDPNANNYEILILWIPEYDTYVE